VSAVLGGFGEEAGLVGKGATPFDGVVDGVELRAVFALAAEFEGFELAPVVIALSPEDDVAVGAAGFTVEFCVAIGLGLELLVPASPPVCDAMLLGEGLGVGSWPLPLPPSPPSPPPSFGSPPPSLRRCTSDLEQLQRTPEKR
jgi:hypothetical protein